MASICRAPKEHRLRGRRLAKKAKQGCSMPAERMRILFSGLIEVHHTMSLLFDEYGTIMVLQ